MATDPFSKGFHPFWDRAIRFLLKRPAHLAAIVRLASPELADRLDFEHLERIERSFVLADYREREADIVVRLPYRGEREPRDVIVYLLVEHQSTVDAWMPFRLLFYMTQLWENERRKAENEAGQAALVPVVPVIFYTGKRPWAAGRRLEDLVAGAPDLLPFCPRFDILYVGLPEIPPAALEAVGPLGWALRAVQRIDASHPEFAEVVKRAELAMRVLVGEEWWELARFLLLLVAYRRPRAEFPEWQELFLQAATDQRWQMEIETMGKSFAEELFEEGELQGRRKGQLSALRMVILRQGCRRFGEPTPEQRARLEAIDSPARFEMLSDAILDATSWDELLRQA